MDLKPPDTEHDRENCESSSRRCLLRPLIHDTGDVTMVKSLAYASFNILNYNTSEKETVIGEFFDILGYIDYNGLISIFLDGPRMYLYSI